ncbi:ATP-binding protein [Pseudomonas sp. MOIL14HWK12:I2]|uniref:ATP-binding protein n=1 Tax=Pseudomonas sp. MOIL14HWK12:I2 TaxID=1033994 RepID=UPI0003FCA7CE|nr:ATP-binding protein [Pseudomonas sp. MOIL14HWK12:I2]
MKAPSWFPQSFFARSLWMVLLAVLFSKALTLVYLLLNEDVLVDRQYSHGAALTLKAYWATPESERPRIAQAAGLRYESPETVPAGEYHWPYSEIFERQMKQELGEETEVRVRVQHGPALWVLAPSLGPDWIKIPLMAHPLRGQHIWSVLGWFFAIGLLSVGAAWVFVRQLNQPLRRLVNAARELGKGRSVRLPETDAPSEIQDVYHAFNQMAEDVEQAGRERELMLAGVSHDLRTPLTRLRLAVELMPPAEREEAEDMIRDIEDMNAILDQFLAFVRDGRDEPQELTNLNELARQVVAPYNQETERVRLKLDVLPPLPVRRISFKRLLTNLVENAQRHGGGGVVEVVGQVAGSATAPYVALSVMDRGPGIDPKDLQDIFNPFTRGNRARTVSGSGLGLAIVKRIAAQHGGSAELRNREGGGVEARVLLPLGLLLPRSAS